MPIYAYECTKCGQDAEYIQKFSDPPMETCEQCGGPLRRQVTSAAFHLKGGGWYKDLYASAKPDKGGAEAGGKGDKGGGDSGGKGSGGEGGGSAASGSEGSASKGSSSSSSEGTKAATKAAAS